MAKSDPTPRGSFLRWARVAVGVCLILGVVGFVFRAQAWEFAKRQVINRVLPVPFEKLTECPWCKGWGKVTYRMVHPLVLIGQKKAGENPCQFCDGTGRMLLSEVPHGEMR
jgi:hypothetical protein